MSSISNLFFNFADYCIDVGLFTGLGYVGGKAVNYYVKVTHPTLFPKAPYLDINTAAFFCGAFSSVDRIAQYAYSRFFSKENQNRISVTISRLALSFSTCFVLQFISQAEKLEVVPLPLEASAAVLGIALVTYGIFTQTLKIWNKSKE